MIEDLFWEWGFGMLNFGYEKESVLSYGVGVLKGIVNGFVLEKRNMMLG